MSELERELSLLAGFVELPVERDLLPGIRARLAVRPRRFLPWRRLAAVAAAVLVVALGTAMAVPDARTAILRFLGLQSVSIIRVDDLPPAARGPSAFGEVVSLAEAQRVVGFRPLLPDIGAPDEVHVDRFTPDFVILLWGRPRTRLRLSELRTGGGLIQKYVLGDQPVEHVRVNGRRALWIRGRHVVSELLGQPRLAGNVLVWEQDGLTLRLEGRLSRERALRIARSVE